MAEGTAQAPTLTHDVLDTTLDLYHTSDSPKSTWRVIVHPVSINQEQTRFAGGYGSFSAHHGVIDRIIEWYGRLRVTSAELAAVRSVLDAFLSTAGTLTFVDDLGYTYTDCVFADDGVMLGEKQRVTGDAEVDYTLDYRITLRQLAP
jgi:hypothetical protein